MIFAKIRACLYAAFFIFSVSITIILMFLFNKSNRAIRRKWAMFQRLFIGYKIIKIGEFDKSADMIIMNHQSMLDIIALEEIYDRNLCWIAKKEIGEIPFIGKILSLPKMIAVDRKNPRDLVRIVHEAKDRVEDGRVIAIFPEGTRRQGNKLLKFQTGAKVIASKLNLKIQPIVLVGTDFALNVRDFTVRKGKIKVICMDMIDTSDEKWLENTRDKMQEILDQNLEKGEA